MLLIALIISEACAQEFRGLWVDTFHPGCKTSNEVTQLVADARAGNFNALIVEVRKRGDAYYESRHEPKADDIAPAFDPLADLITKAHDTNSGPRLEVHAWIVTYNIWHQEATLPSQPNHPFRLHPEWLTQNSLGARWDGENYAFDPGVPEVQQHIFDVAMDIITRYDVDGFNFDYVRYAGNTWGYHPVSVARFNQRFGRAGQPEPTDPDWLQFRRDQVTALVRKVYLSAIAVKPMIKISADTITWAPGIITTADWTNNTAAYKHVLQDWRAWMEEGILDLNIPMVYFRQNLHPRDWAAWNDFAKDHRYDRHLAIGAGFYLNTMSRVLAQIRHTRTKTAKGNTADGLVGYSYAVPVSNKVTRATFLAALTKTNVARRFSANAQPVFAAPASTPDMPWKTAPTLGYLKGFVAYENATQRVDAATITVQGPVTLQTISDGTGFYGLARLPPGPYQITASDPLNRTVALASVSIQPGKVATADLVLQAFPQSTEPPASSFLATSGTSSNLTLWTPAVYSTNNAGALFKNEPLTNHIRGLDSFSGN